MREMKHVAVKISKPADITEVAIKKEKYPVNVIFDGDMEVAIKQRAKEQGLGVATYIKMLVSKDLNG